jgi:hypothetical protein
MIPHARRPHEVGRYEGAYNAPYKPIADQSGKERADVNNIIATYHRTGIMPGVARRQPKYGEVPDMDFNESAQIAAETASAHEERVMAEEFGNVPPAASEGVSEGSTAESAPVAETVPEEQGSLGTENPVPELTNEGT